MIGVEDLLHLAYEPIILLIYFFEIVYFSLTLNLFVKKKTLTLITSVFQIINTLYHTV